MNPEENKSPIDEKKKETVVSVSHQESFSGPIPHPSILAGYEKVLPGLAHRIMMMAETQSKHRQKLESGVITWDKIKSAIGLVFAFFIVIFALFLSYKIVIIGKPYFAGFIAAFPLVAIVGAFIYQTRDRSDSDKE